MKTICFVCTGNTCRSIMAEHIMKKYLKENNLNFKVISCGTNIVLNDKTNDNTIKALKNLGINARKKNAKQIDEKIIKKCSLVLTMNTNQKNRLNYNKVYTIGEMVGGIDIPDPYGQSQEVYNHTAKMIDEYIKQLINKMLSIKENI